MSNIKTTDQKPKRPAVKKERYIVDVYSDGAYALFPDSTVRQFRSMDEAQIAIRVDCLRRADKKVIHVAVIEWNARDNMPSHLCTECLMRDEDHPRIAGQELTHSAERKELS